MTLGILSVCLFWLSWPGLVLGIIGLCVRKREDDSAREWDIALNTIGIILSFLWTLYILTLIGA